MFGVVSGMAAMGRSSCGTGLPFKLAKNGRRL